MSLEAERNMLIEQVLRPIGSRHPSLKREKLTPFLALQGADFKGELLCIGRAVNGWTDGASPFELANRDAAKALGQEAFHIANGNGACPMAWVAEDWSKPRPGYATGRSAFWRVINAMTFALPALAGPPASWSSRLAWSNLYKVAPAVGGNPSNKLCNIQFPGCVEILRLEIQRMRPRRILMLTGIDWASPFIGQLGGRIEQSSPGNLVEAVGAMPVHGSIGTARLVVAKHPQGKSERKWVVEVLSSFK